MRLSMTMLGDYLSMYAPECRITRDRLSIRGVRFFSEQAEVHSPEFVYIGPASAYFHDARYADAVLLANGQSHILCHSADTLELLNDVLAAFDYYNALEQELSFAAARHSPAAEMTAIVGRMLPGTFLVFGLDGTLLSAAHPEKLRDLAMAEALRAGNKISLSAMGAVLVDPEGKISHDLSFSPQHLRPQGGDTLGAVSMYLGRDSERVGFIMYFPAQERYTALGLALESMLAVPLAEAAEFTDALSLHLPEPSILRQLLSGAEVPDSSVHKLSERIRFAGRACLVCFRSLSIRNQTFRHVFLQELMDSRLPCVACEQGDLVLILSGEESPDRVIEHLSQTIPRENLSLGVSMPIEDLHELDRARRQAEFALNASSAPGVRFCRELSLEYLLQTLRRDEMTADLLHPAIGLLREYDRKNSGELLRTLQSYVSLGSAQAEAAQAMHIHLNTLKYRLRRIAELTGIDYRNNDDMFYLQLSLSLDES